MDKMSITSILLVSFPEAILIVISTLTIAGYKDILNFKEKKNFLKLFLCSLIMIIFSVVCRAILPLATLNFILMAALYPIIIYSIYHYRVAPTILGVIVSLVVLMLGEAVSITTLLKTIGLSLESVYLSNILRVLFSLPTRLFQLITIIIMCKLRNINLSFIRLSLNEWFQIILFSFVILSSMFSIESGFKNIDRDINTITKLIVNIFIAIIFSFWMILNIFRVKKRSKINEKINTFELKRIKNLLLEGHTEHVIKLINIKISGEGRNNEI